MGTEGERRRLPGIEGVRAVAALAVVAHHTRLYAMPAGTQVGSGRTADLLGDLALGVALFFALSGFLLYRPFVAAALEPGRAVPDVRRYLANRAARILPAYWVILLLCSIVLAEVGTGGGRLGRLTDPGDWLRALTLSYELTPGTFGLGLGPAWSLAVEAVFYLVLPLLGLATIAAARRAGTRARAAVVALGAPAALLVLGLSGKAVAGKVVPGPSGFAGDWHSVIIRSFWGQADLFSFGMALAVLHVLVARRALHLPRWWAVPALGTLVVLAVPVSTLGGASLDENWRNTAAGLMAAIVVALVVLARSDAWHVRLLERRAVVWVGLCSYSVFLWNEQLARFLARHGITLDGGAGAYLADLAIVLAVVLMLSTLTYRLVERPALAWRARRSTRSVPAAQVEAAP